jgi:hypothetical protein
MSVALKIKQPNVARQEGERARLKVVRGPDAGVVFVITGSRATIGRGEDNDIVLSDLKTSRKHAEVVLTPDGWHANDLGSVNGFSFNGKTVKNAQIKTKDTLALGETILEFADAEAGTRVISAPPATPEQIEDEQAKHKAQRAKVIAISQFGGLAKNIPAVDDLTKMGGGSARPAVRAASPSKPIDPKKLLLIVAAAVGAFYFMTLDDGGQKSAPPPKKAEAAKKGDLSEYLPSSENPVVEKTADAFFKTGFREYRLGNFLRAKSQFETVLQIAPDHRLARLYLQNCEDQIDGEVREHLEIGRKEMLGGKLKESRGHFEAVLRLLFRDPKNPAYTEAQDQLKQLTKLESEDTE